ncbi:MAG: isocitrate lyase/phosphoenolpyruvate mutase family protein [Pseudomonadota bacterium]
MTSQQAKCERFAELHQRDSAFVIPNPWDVGSARVLQGLGFEALATTSSALAYTLGRVDGQVTLEEKLAHCEALAAGTDIPISADFENGFSDDAEGVAANVLAIAATGVAGCSIEDYNPSTDSIYDFNHSVERVQAACEAIQSLNMPFQLTARAENLIRGVDDQDDTIKRLKAFESVGANVLYAPAVKSLAQLKEVTAKLNTPFNALAPYIKDASVEEFFEAGAQRISVGGALNWAAVNPLVLSGKEMLEAGTFSWVDQMASAKYVNDLLSS